MTARIQENHNVVVIPRLVFQDCTGDKVLQNPNISTATTALYTRPSKARRPSPQSQRQDSPSDMTTAKPCCTHGPTFLDFNIGSNSDLSSWSSSPSLSRSRSPHSSSTSVFTSCPASPSPEPSPAVAKTYWQRQGNNAVTTADYITTIHLRNLPAKNSRQNVPARPTTHATRPARTAPYARPTSARRLSPRGHFTPNAPAMTDLSKAPESDTSISWPSSLSRSSSSHSSSSSYPISTAAEPSRAVSMTPSQKQANNAATTSDHIITIRLRNLPSKNQSSSVCSTHSTRPKRTAQRTLPINANQSNKKELASLEPITRPRRGQGNNAVTTTDHITTIRLRGLTVKTQRRGIPARAAPYSKASSTMHSTPRDHGMIPEPAFTEPATVEMATASASNMSVSYPSWPSLSSSLPSFSSSSSSFSSCPESPTSEVSSITSGTSVHDITTVDRVAPSSRNTKAKLQQQTREVIVISSDDEDDDDSKGSGPSTPTSAPSNEKHKYRIASNLRRVVDTIFPAVEVEHKNTLERAYATSKTLRENYLITRYLGSGASGFVVAAKRVFDGREVAIKVIPHTADHIEGRVQKELDIMLRLKEHDNVIEFLEYFTSSLYGDIDPDDQSNKDISYIVTEMGGFSLFDFIELHKPAQQKDASTRFKNIQELPRSSPPSMDENALISMDPATKTYRAKLCDFGHSKYLAPGTPPGFAFYGTTVLAPPEMDKNVAAREQARDPNRRSSSQTKKWDVFSGYEADVWALGLTLYTMIQGDLPKELMEADSTRAHRRTRASRTTFPFAMPDNVDRDLQDLLKKMLAVDPTRRLTMSQVIKHPWILRASRSSHFVNAQLILPLPAPELRARHPPRFPLQHDGLLLQDPSSPYHDKPPFDGLLEQYEYHEYDLQKQEQELEQRRQLEEQCRNLLEASERLDPLPEPQMVGVSSAPENSTWRLWYRKPAKSVETDGFLIGNGRTQVLVGGAINVEQLILNEESCWTGGPGSANKSTADNGSSESESDGFEYRGGNVAESEAEQRMEALKKFRDTLKERPVIQSSMPIVKTLQGDERGFGRPEAFGEVVIEEVRPFGKVENYRRELDLELGVVRVTFTSDNVEYTREHFCSNPDSICAMRIQASQPKSIYVKVSLKNYHDRNVEYTNVHNRLGMRAQLTSNNLTIDAQVMVIAEGGSGVSMSNNLHVIALGFDTVTLYYSIGTGWTADGFPKFEDKDPHDRLVTAVTKAKEMFYVDEYDKHVKDHQGLFQGFTLDLGQPNNSFPTNELLRDSREDDTGEEEGYLEALMVQYSRYLLIASSRSGSLPISGRNIWSIKEGLAEDSL
ncbi:hypothetical protein BGZ65_002628, partial [Modicella reniformis]